MIRFTVSCLIGLCIATLVSMQFGGARGTGVMMGFFGGAGLTGLGVSAQRYVMLHLPARIMQVHVLAFLAKIVALAVMTIAFRTNDALAQSADYAAFAVTFAAVVAVLLPIGAMDVGRLSSKR